MLDEIRLSLNIHLLMFLKIFHKKCEYQRDIKNRYDSIKTTSLQSNKCTLFLVSRCAQIQ
jgi:hypothetical protein